MDVPQTHPTRIVRSFRTQLRTQPVIFPTDNDNEEVHDATMTGLINELKITRLSSPITALTSSCTILDRFWEFYKVAVEAIMAVS